MATSRFPGASWAPLQAPSIEDIEAIAEAAYARLPSAFRDLTGEVVIKVEDFPDEETLEELDADDEFELLGLFQGVGLAQGRAAPETGQFPNTVTLYRRPILDYWAEHEETLGDLVAHVLVHEIGHHFGLSDADMERIEASAT
jgi:predicted Zn-dependent protease with MMP-like domain